MNFIEECGSLINLNMFDGDNFLNNGKDDESIEDTVIVYKGY